MSNPYVSMGDFYAGTVTASAVSAEQFTDLAGRPFFSSITGINLGSSAVANVGYLNVAQDEITLSSGTTGVSDASVRFEYVDPSTSATKWATLTHRADGIFNFANDGVLAPVLMRELKLEAQDAGGSWLGVSGTFSVYSDHGNLVFSHNQDGVFMVFAPPGAGLVSSGPSASIAISKPITIGSTAVFTGLLDARLATVLLPDGVGGGSGSGPWTTVNSNLSFMSGYVGIGTTSPVAPLHIDRGTSTSSALVLSSSSTGKGSGLTLQNSAVAGRSWAMYSGSDGAFHLGETAAAKGLVVLKPNSASVVYETAIASDNPTSAQTANYFAIKQADSNTACGLWMGIDSNGDSWTHSLAPGLAWLSANQRAVAYSYFIGGANTPRLSLNSTGAGINTNDPLYDLDVLGTTMGIRNVSNNNRVCLHSQAGFGAIECLQNNATSTKVPLCLQAWGGRTGFGTTSPCSPFHVATTDSYFYKTLYIGQGQTIDHNVWSAGVQLNAFDNGWTGCDLAFKYNWQGGPWGTEHLFTNAGRTYNTTGTYGSLSDFRLKENIVDARSYEEDLNQLRVVRYSFKSENAAAPTSLGLIAQQVEEVFPTLVETSREQHKMVKTSVLSMMMLKTIQELSARNKELARQVEALKQWAIQGAAVAFQPPTEPMVSPALPPMNYPSEFPPVSPTADPVAPIQTPLVMGDPVLQSQVVNVNSFA